MIADAGARFNAAPMDRSTRLWSALFCTVLLFVALSVSVEEAGAAAIVFGYVVPALGLVAAYGLSPAAYVVLRDGRLRVVRRLFGGRTFRITEASVMDRPFGLGGIRLAGSGGAFGWYGLFWRKELGRYRAYVTNRMSVVACHGPDGLIVVSPDDAQAFIAAAARTP